MTDKRRRALLLIDAENINGTSIPHALWEAEGIADEVEARAFGRASALIGRQELLDRLGISQTQCQEASPGKNSTDIRIAIEATDAIWGGDYDAICIMSDDTDFCHVAERARKSGVESVLMHAKPVNETVTEAFDRCPRLLNMDSFEAVRPLIGDRRPEDLYSDCARLAAAMGAGRIAVEETEMDAAKRVAHDTVVNAGGSASESQLRSALKRNRIYRREAGYDRIEDLVEATEGLVPDGSGGARLATDVEMAGEAVAVAEAAALAADESAAPEAEPAVVEPQAPEEAAEPEHEPESEPPAEPVTEEDAKLAAKDAVLEAGGSISLGLLGDALKSRGVDYRAAGFKRLKDLAEELDGATLSGTGGGTVLSLPGAGKSTPEKDEVKGELKAPKPTEKASEKPKAKTPMRARADKKLEASEQPERPSESVEKAVDEKPRRTRTRRGGRGRGAKSDGAKGDGAKPETTHEPRPAESEKPGSTTSDRPEVRGPEPVSPTTVRPTPEDAQREAKRILSEAGAPVRLTKLGSALKAAGINYREAGFPTLSKLVKSIPGAVVTGKSPLTEASLEG